MQHDGFRIPDRVFAVLAIVVLVLTWALLIWAWPMLPERIPTHFGISGQPDGWSDKNFWSVFIPVLLPTILGAVFLWLYRSNQSFNIPSSVRLKDMPEPEKTILTKLGRHLLTMLYVLFTLIFAYLSLAIVSVGIGARAGLSSGVMLGLTAFLLLVVATYTFWMAKVAKRGAAKGKEG